MNTKIQSLRKKYSHLFSPNCEISVGDGWYYILDTLLSSIDNHIQFINDRHKTMIERINAVKNKDWEHKSLKSSWDLNVMKTSPDIWISEAELGLDRPIENFCVGQVKEKFGTLRVYYSGGDERIFGFTSMAEAISTFTCEECGNIGSAISGGWIKTLCDKHAEERKKNA
jgi:hypothetical protein